jgi:hypothetical protein
VNDACTLAALAALCFDADQARKAEWYDAYPNVSRGPSEHAIRCAKAFPAPLPTPQVPDNARADARSMRAFGLLKNLSASEFSTFSALVHTTVGSEQAVMSAIEDIVKREIDWQLSLLKPMYVVPLRPRLTGTTDSGTTSAGITSTAATGVAQTQQDLRATRRRKRKRSLVQAPGSPGSPTPPERKRSRLTPRPAGDGGGVDGGSPDCVKHGYRVVSNRSSTPVPEPANDELVRERTSTTISASPPKRTEPSENLNPRGGHGRRLWTEGSQLGGREPVQVRTSLMTRSGTRGRRGRGRGEGPTVAVVPVAGSSKGYLLRPRHPHQ